MLVFERFGHTFRMSEDDFQSMLERMAHPIHPVGRTFSECGTKSNRELPYKGTVVHLENMF